MLSRSQQLIALFGLVSLAGGLTQAALGQRGAGQGQAKAEQGPGSNYGGQAAREPSDLSRQSEPSKVPKPGIRGMLGLPPPWIEWLLGMPPEEQERFLNNNEHFKSLPPDQQA